MNSYSDDMDSWFNELDEKSLEIINEKIDNGMTVDTNSNEIINVEQGSKMEPENDTITECVCVDDIILCDPSEMSSHRIIQNQCSIAYFVQVLIEGTEYNNRIRTTKVHDNELTKDKVQSVIEYLSWISLSAGVLANKIGQEFCSYKVDRVPLIIRSSYNFCTKYTQCKNFYSKHVEPTCKEHHYVHSLLKYDVDSVIAFLTHTIKNRMEISNDELNNLYLSIKTIYFVTRHMAKEISYIDYITKNNSEAFHRNNPIDLTKRWNRRPSNENAYTHYNQGQSHRQLRYKSDKKISRCNRTQQNKHRERPAKHTSKQMANSFSNRYSVLSEA